MSNIKTTEKPEIYIAGIARNNPLSFRIKSKITKPIYKATILIIILLIASLSTLVFSRTSFWTANNVNLSIDSDFTLFVDVTNNRVGINTSDPTATLQVNGSVRVVPLVSCDTIDTDANGLLSCGTDASGGAIAWNASGTAVYLNDTSDSVGIGTSSPDAKLHVVGTGNVLKVDGSDIGPRAPDTVASFTKDWSTATNNEIVYDMVVFNDTYLYAAGVGAFLSPSYIIILKLNKSLQVEWNLSLNFSDASNSYTSLANAIDVDDSGNAFVVGYVTNVSTSQTDWVIVRVNASGKQDWNKSINFSGGNDYANGVAWVNRSNTIIVSGQSVDGSGQTIQIIASLNTTDGTQLWNTTANFSIGLDLAYKVDVFNESAYIAGYTTVTGPTNNMFTLVKLNTTSGAQLCNATTDFMNNSNNEQAYDVVVDSSGNAYVAGTITSQNSHWTLAKYNSSCVIQWNYTSLTGITSTVLTLNANTLRSLAIYNNTHIIGVGDDTTPGLGSQIRVAKHNMSNGALEWTFGDNFAVATDNGYAVATDSNGAIFVGGYYTTLGTTAWYISKYANYSSNQNATILYVNSSGRVGILTTNPQAELDVNGRLFQRGLTLFSDIAEDYPVSDNASYGDVVVWDADKPMHVKKAIGKYNPNIAGVLSETPGYRIYAGRDDWKALALVGRVSVKVSDENGEIKIGDLLTSSSMQGVAMKATEPGATLGIALEEFNASGTGNILTYVKVEQGYIEMFRKYEKEIAELRKEIEEIKRR